MAAPPGPGPVDRPQPAQAGPSLAHRERLEDVPHPVRPAALEIGRREGLGDGGGDAPGAIGGHQANRVRVEAALDQRAQEAAPLGGRFGGSLAVVEQLPAAVRVDGVAGEDDPPPGSGAGPDRDPQAVEQGGSGPGTRDRPAVEGG